MAGTSATSDSGDTGRERVIHILPLGDSVTQGGRADRPEYTYRYPLYYMLRNAGYAVDFIGSQQGGLDPEAVWPDRDGVAFDPDHEGHYGCTTAEVRDLLKERIGTYPAAPEIALVHLGSNDTEAPSYHAAIIRPLKDIVGLLRQRNPRVVVLIGHLNYNGWRAWDIRQRVELMAWEINSPLSPVVTVAHQEGWHENPDHPDTDTFDWGHPNPKGQRKMAEKWLAAMRPFLERLTKP